MTWTLSVASPQYTFTTVVVMLLKVGVGGLVGGTESGAASVVKVTGADGGLLL